MSAESGGRLLSVAACVARDLLGRRHGQHQAQAHLLGALEWLGRAQDATGGAGVSFAFGLKRGWLPPYPETTGYLIPTLYAASDRLEDARWGERADRMARWLVELQMADGSYPGGTVDLAPRAEVFNTGMIIFGLVAAHRRGGRDRYLQSAERAAEWLVATQDADGAWSRHSYQGVAHTYHTRVAWALLHLHDMVPRSAFRDAATRQLRWAAGQQRGNGWLELCAFEPDVPPFTHTLAYAVRGMLEGGLLLGDGGLVDRADRATRAVLARYEADGFLGARYDGEWRTSDRYACLTGCAQFACLWFRLFEVDGDRRWLEAAQRLTSYVASTQDLASRHPGIRGGIKGSLPVWGGYLPFRYPNWAAKFFVDALLLEERLAHA